MPETHKPCKARHMGRYQVLANGKHFSHDRGSQNHERISLFYWSIYFITPAQYIIWFGNRHPFKHNSFNLLTWFHQSLNVFCVIFRKLFLTAVQSLPECLKGCKNAEIPALVHQSDVHHSIYDQMKGIRIKLCQHWNITCWTISNEQNIVTLREQQLITTLSQRFKKLFYKDILFAILLTGTIWMYCIVKRKALSKTDVLVVTCFSGDQT